MSPPGNPPAVQVNGHRPAGEITPIRYGPEPVPDDGEDPSVRRVRVTPASAIQMRPVRWLWADRIPAGAITLMPGREGIGKSLALTHLAARLTRGQLPGQHHGKPSPVIYAATEDSWSHTIGPRLYAAGADMDLVYRVDVELDGSVTQLTLPLDCRDLAREISRLKVVMLAADPLLSLIDGRIDAHRDRDLRTALEPLAQLADSTGCAVVGLAHFNKSAGADALNLITGSRAFAAVARAVLAVASDPAAGDGSCVMSQAKNNLGRLDLPSLRYIIRSAEVPTPEGPASVGVLTFTGETGRGVAEILAESSAGPHEHAERDQAAGWLTGYLADLGGEAPRTDVLKAARAEGFSERTLQRAMSRAGVNVRREGFPSRTIGRLGTGDAAPPAAPVAPQSCQVAPGPRAGATGATGARLPDTDHSPSPDTGRGPARNHQATCRTPSHPKETRPS